MIRIAITKGKIEKNFNKLLENSKFDIKTIEKKQRKLLIRTKDNIEMVFLKPIDVLKFVDKGLVDIGVVGKDTLNEENYNNYKELLDLNTGKCYFALAGYPKYKNLNPTNIKKIATKYPNIAKTYFKEKNIKVEIIKMEGSVELGAVIGMADAIVDIVETGSTLQENGLIVLDKICDISTRLIVNKNSLDRKSNEIYSLIEKIKIF